MRQLLVIASAATCSLSTFAQSSVTLYGRIDVSTIYTQYERTATRAAENEKKLASEASAFGFTGSENLGGGRRAYFKLESGFNVDTGAQSDPARFFNRESFVGLGDARFGSVQLGSQWTPSVSTSGRIDPFQRFGLGAQPTLLQGVRGYPVQHNNAVQYLSPVIGGFSGRAIYAAGEGAPTGRAVSGEIEYSNGPLLTTMNYEQFKATAASVGLVGTPVWSKTLAVGASYDFKLVKIHAWYQTNRIENLRNVNGYMLGFTVPVGAGDIRGSYVHRDAANADASLAAIGYYYPLSKRTLLYTHVGVLKNAGTAAFGLGPTRGEAAATPGLLAAGRDARGIQFAMRHSF